MRRGRLEIVTVGLNPNLQTVSSDPAGGGYGLGLWIGANGGPQTPQQRQLFLLVSKRFNAGQRGRLVGFRQYLTIGTYLPVASADGALYPLERPVETPTWQFLDGNVLWGIRQVPPESHFQPNLQNSEGLAFETAQTPAQLFETIVGNVITPPFGGVFPGNVLAPELGRFFDLRCRRWSRPSHCDIPFEGPCDIAFFASVQQTSPNNRENPPVAPIFSTTQGAVPEDAFLQTYPGSFYFRIAGSLIFEMEEQAPTGAPKTYRRPGDADRITRDTTETGDNVMRRSAEDTSEYKAAVENKPIVGRERPLSPPHVSQSLGALPKESGGVISRILRQWRTGHGKPDRPVPERGSGLGSIPYVPEDPISAVTIDRIVRKWRKGGPV